MWRVLVAALLCAMPCAAGAQTVASPPPSSIPAILEALATSPEQPVAYHASVALHVRLRIFPFIRMTLHGESTYKRPGLYRFIFHGVPVIAKAFSDMKYDLGDPAHWADRYDVSFAPESNDEHPVLRLVPKTAMLVKTLDVALDPSHGRILRAVWSRNDGGVITLTQAYAPGLAGHDVVAKQDATIDLPRMKASLEAEYADFAVIENN